MTRMRQLMNQAKSKEGLTDQEKQELQRLFVNVATQDMLILEEMEDSPEIVGDNE
jgi:hypothetical protein